MKGSNSNRSRSNTSFVGNTEINSFHAIQTRLNRNIKNNLRQKQKQQSSLVNRRRYKEDILDKCTDICCDNGKCLTYDFCNNYVECIHNLDRIYCKLMCFIVNLFCFVFVNYCMLYRAFFFSFIMCLSSPLFLANYDSLYNFVLWTKRTHVIIRPEIIHYDYSVILFDFLNAC